MRYGNIVEPDNCVELGGRSWIGFGRRAIFAQRHHHSGRECMYRVVGYLTFGRPSHLSTRSVRSVGFGGLGHPDAVVAGFAEGVEDFPSLRSPFRCALRNGRPWPAGA